MDISTFCNSTSTSALVKLGLGLPVLALKWFWSVSEVAFALPVECAHVAIACPYKELAGRFCMQVQVHEKAGSINPLKSTLPVQGYGGFYGELLLKLSQFLSERHRNYTPRNLEPFSFQIYTVWNKYINKHFVRRIGLVSCTFQSLSEVSAPNDPPISKWQLFIW